MSGYVVVVNLDKSPVSESLISKMTGCLAFRGPDRQSVKVLGAIGIGYALLKTGATAECEEQPLSLDGRRWIIGDVRLDGRAELAAAMQSRVGVDLRGISDAGLALAAWDLWGEKCLDHLYGDFSFVIVDIATNALFAARDHFGIRPFYYASLPRTLIISNTLKAVRLHPAATAEPNLRVVGDYLIVGSNKYPDQTFFRDISQLEAGHCLSLTPAGVVVARYWSLTEEEEIHYRRDGDYIDHFNELLDTAVGERLTGQSAGLLMSGGLDSTTVAATAKRAGKNRSDALRLRAWTVINRRFFDDQEIDYSKLAADHLGIPIEQTSIDDYRLLESAAGEQGLDAPPGGFTYYGRQRYRRYSQFSPVMLTGQGGDLLLSPSADDLLNRLTPSDLLSAFRALIGHYWRYHRLPRIGLRTALRRSAGFKHYTGPYPQWIARDFEQQLQLRERHQHLNCAQPNKWTRRTESHFYLSRPLISDMFAVYDAASTGSPVDVRHPLFDMRLVRYCLRLPSLPWCINKHMLRAAAGRSLPREILRRKKTTLPVTLIRAIVQTDGYTAFKNIGLLKEDIQTAITTEMRPWIDVSRADSLIRSFKKLAACFTGAPGQVADLDDMLRLASDIIRLETLNIWCRQR